MKFFVMGYVIIKFAKLRLLTKWNRVLAEYFETSLTEIYPPRTLFQSSLASSVFRIQDEEFSATSLAQNTPALQAMGNRSCYFAVEEKKIIP